MSKVGLEKAKIIVLDGGGIPIICMFNPQNYTIKKQNTWKQSSASGKDTSPLTFENGSPAVLDLQLFFDTYEQRIDVRTCTQRLWELMKVRDKLTDINSSWGRPPRVQFQWGSYLSFIAVITNITQKFTLFLPEGIPVRATLDVSFLQADLPIPLKPQNPTSGGIGGERVWTVGVGDTLAAIAYHEYGDPNRWRLIAEANQHQLANVRRLMPGMILVIPNA